MKKKRLLSLACTCILALSTSIAQTTTVASTSIKGTPYLDEAYADGVIFFANNKRTAPIRYNAYKDLIEYKQDGIARVLDPTTTIKKVCVDSSTFVVEQYDNKGKAAYGYFELLDSGKVKLYAKKVVKYVPPLKGRALDGSDQPAEFKRSADVFFYKVGDSPLQPVGSVKSIISSLPDQQDELTRFAKAEKISPRKEEELKKLFRHYNSL